MATRLSRRKIATFAANKLVAGESVHKVMQSVAAYLVDARRTRELELLVRDIEAILADQGTVVADVTSAHPLTQGIKAEFSKLVGATSLQLRESIDESVLGGVKIELPGKRFDGTIRRKLTALKAKQL